LLAVQDHSLRILVVDDNRSAADGITRVLRRAGDDVTTCYDGSTAIDALRVSNFDAVLTDLRMEPVDGMEVLRASQDLPAPPEVIVFTAYGEVETAVEAMRLGARDFLTKPVTIEQVQARLDSLRRPAGSQDVALAEAPFIARSAASRRLLDTLKQIADVHSPVWMEGEVGSGRGHAALTLHRIGRPNQPFTVFRPFGDLVWPEQGTVVLHHVDHWPTEKQAWLVSALEPPNPHVRVISITEPGASKRVTDGTLRRDLFYSLSVLSVAIPPLRERPDDVMPLVEHARQTLAARHDRTPPPLTTEQRQRLETYSWPGNVRELFNLVERAVVTGEWTIRGGAPTAPIVGLPSFEDGFSLSDHMESIERAILVEALRLSDGDRTQAGRILGVERNTLRYKLNKYGLLD
jgi:DNA-binding NtrC family response regulator